MKRLSVAIVLPLLLVGCGFFENAEPTDEQVARVRTAETGIAAAFNIAKTAAIQPIGGMRPGPSLGIYVSSYLAQGVFVQVTSAMDGIEAQRRLIAGHSTPTTSETFALLTELATIMQVNIPDMLNRSTNRTQALNEYVNSLRATGEVAEQKYHELEARLEQLEDRRRDERDVANDLERNINRAFRDEDYSTAAEQQEDLATAEAKLAQTESEIDQTRNIIRRYEDLLEIADERLQAIIRNREVLIAGLRVTEMPGVEGLEVLEEERRSYRRDGDDIFGTQHIREEE